MCIRDRLYSALADAEALAPVRELYEDGLSGMEAEFAQYLEAVSTLEQCGIPREQLISEKAQVYQQLALSLIHILPLVPCLWSWRHFLWRRPLRGQHTQGIFMPESGILQWSGDPSGTQNCLCPVSPCVNMWGPI